MKVQVMTEKQAEEAWEQKRINVFDLTHIWPHGDYPLRTVGKFTLNENAKVSQASNKLRVMLTDQNYFAEVEQVAFNPSHMVPGIEPSNDPVLQSRLFSYPDAHRHRIGANYQQLPVNQSACPFMAGNFQRDGQMAFYNQGSRPNYLSSIEPISFKERAYDLNKVHGKFTGEAVAFLSEIRPEDFNAPRALWEKVYCDESKERFIETVSGHMSTVRDKQIVARMMTIFGEVSSDLGARLEKATGVKNAGDIATMKFNGTHNGWNKDSKIPANGMKSGGEVVFDNGAPQSAKA
jgi:catalase